eukprot:TRINITY_DN8106_c0_g1_i1.p1 TRINITY_DN8106_c0_g1~~TRINITY_DN8106_c0_g1_i1.p1  ORF type:complete len:299 (-),score=75.88 TRINITY_DN8106_c0_g1_i1:137-1033(-)
MEEKDKDKEKEEERVEGELEGYLELRKKTMGNIFSWRKHFFVLHGGSLFEFESSSDSKPHNEYQLKTLKLKDFESQSRKHAFALDFGEKEVVLSTHTEEEKKLWTTSLAQAVDKPATSCTRKSTKKGLVYRAANSLSGKVATSFAGRKLIREFVPDIVINTLDSLKKFVEKLEGPEKAENFEKNILRLSTKLALLFKNGKITHQDIQPLHQPLNQVYAFVIDGYEGLPSFKVETMFETFLVVKSLLLKLFVPHFKPKSVVRLNNVLEYITLENMAKFFSDENREVATKVYETIVSMYY